MEEKKQKRALELFKATSNIPLAQLNVSFDINEKLDALLAKEIEIPEPVEEVAIANLPEVQKVEITNLPEEKDDTEQIKLLQEILAEAKKKEQYAYDIEIDADLKEELKGKDGVDGRDGADGRDGINAEEIKPEQITEKLNTLEEKIDGKVIKGYKELATSVDLLKRQPQIRGGGFVGVSKIIAGAGMAITPSDGRGDVTILSSNNVSKTITYNADGTVNTVSDSTGTKTMVWSAGVLTGINGTGVYKNKTFVYSGSQLTNINIS